MIPIALHPYHHNPIQHLNLHCRQPQLSLHILKLLTVLSTLMYSSEPTVYLTSNGTPSPSPLTTLPTTSLSTQTLSHLPTSASRTLSTYQSKLSTIFTSTLYLICLSTQIYPQLLIQLLNKLHQKDHYLRHYQHINQFQSQHLLKHLKLYCH